jgi:hypothetical protein
MPPSLRSDNADVGPQEVGAEMWVVTLGETLDEASPVVSGTVEKSDSQYYKAGV